MKAPSPSAARAGLAICLIFSVTLLGCPPTSTPSPFITPTITPPTTSPFACPNTVSMSDLNGAATIYYSTTGIPVANASGTVNFNQTGVFQVNGPGLVTVTAMAKAPGLSQSPYVTATFSCPALPQPPTFTPAPTAQETCPLNVQVNAAAGTNIVVSNNGQAPSATNNVYAGSPPSSQSVPAPNGETLEAIACTAGLLCSAPASATYTCPVPPPPATFDTIDMLIQTGNDNADQNLEILALMSGEGQTTPTGFTGAGTLCLKPSNDSSLPGTAAMGTWGDCMNGNSNAPSWGNGFVFDLTNSAGLGPIRLRHPVTPQQLSTATMEISATQSGCSLSCSNWDIQDIIVSFSDSTGRLSPTTLAIGTFVGSGWNSNNCVARLKAPPNATTIRFGLGNSSQGTPPPPIMYLFYADGNEANQNAICTDNGDGGTPP